MALSKVIGIYRLSQEPEMRYLASGTEVCKLNLVNSSKYKTQTGEQREETCFIEGTCFSGLAKIASQYLKKGSKIYIVAELKQDTWQDQNGQNKSKHTLKIDSFEMLDSKLNDNQGQRSQSQNNYQPKKQHQQDIPEIDLSIDDEVPFNRG